MSAPLYTCPRCGRSGFYAQGIRSHVCRGSRPDDARRRLTQYELQEAAAQAARQIAVQCGPDNPDCLRKPAPRYPCYRVRRFSRMPARTYVVQCRMARGGKWHVFGDGTEPVVYGTRDEAKAVKARLENAKNSHV